MNIDTTFWHWPQYTLLVLLVLRMAVAMSRHGKPVKVDAWTILFHTVIILFVLVCGGFYR